MKLIEVEFGRDEMREEPERSERGTLSLQVEIDRTVYLSFYFSTF